MVLREWTDYKLVKNDRFWQASSYSRREDLVIHMKEILYENCHWVIGDVCPTNMVKTLFIEVQRTRKPNANKAVPLDVVPERRTKRFSPRFRPGGRFCGLSFRYLSPGIEGEKCRPLDHMWQIPFIHSTPFIVASNFYIYVTEFYLFPSCGTSRYVSVWVPIWLIVRALL